MTNDNELFGQLSESDKTVAIDLTVACSLLVTRLPHLSGNFMDAVMTEFARQYEVPNNVAKYSLRAVGRELFNSAWKFEIIKDSQENVIGTHFIPQGEEPELVS